MLLKIDFTIHTFNLPNLTLTGLYSIMEIKSTDCKQVILIKSNLALIDAVLIPFLLIMWTGLADG